MASLGRLAAALSHEFNSPIGTLKSAVDTLLRAASKQDAASASEQPGLATLQAELRKSIDESLARMQEVIARIQRFTNLDRAETQSVDLNELLGDVIAVVQTDPEIGEGEITLDSRPLPELVCHPHHMSSAFSGLFGFLMKCCREDTKPVGEIRVATRAGADRIEIEITGKGSSLSERELARIFDPKFEVARGRVTTGNWSLFTARQLIRDQGGEINISSREDGQIKIFVTLPADNPLAKPGD
jgi:two-component system C4-dicarboxylate transport sensor histidine kinase DctB